MTTKKQAEQVNFVNDAAHAPNGAAHFALRQPQESTARAHSPISVPCPICAQKRNLKTSSVDRAAPAPPRP